MIDVYVDDVPMSGNKDGSPAEVVNYFKGSFKVVVSSKFEKFFEFCVQDEEDTAKLHNAPMVRSVLKAFELQNCKLLKNLLPNELYMITNNLDEITDASSF